MKEIEQILINLVKIFDDHELRTRSKVIRNLLEKISLQQIEEEELAGKIIDLYGGMGSFFDIVLTKSGKPLIEENDKLSQLKNDLFEECINIRTSNPKAYK
jgi:hypothetical protein